LKREFVPARRKRQEAKEEGAGLVENVLYNQENNLLGRHLST